MRVHKRRRGGAAAAALTARHPLLPLGWPEGPDEGFLRWNLRTPCASAWAALFLIPNCTFPLMLRGLLPPHPEPVEGRGGRPLTPRFPTPALRQAQGGEGSPWGGGAARKSVRAKKHVPAPIPAPILGSPPAGTDTETISPSVPDGRRRRSAAGRVQHPFRCSRAGRAQCALARAGSIKSPRRAAWGRTHAPCLGVVARRFEHVSRFLEKAGLPGRFAFLPMAERRSGEADRPLLQAAGGISVARTKRRVLRHAGPAAQAFPQIALAAQRLPAGFELCARACNCRRKRGRFGPCNQSPARQPS